MSVKFLQGAALEVHNRVFNPLAQSLQSVKESKEYYKASPYVKLRTTHETDPSTVQVSCYLIARNSLFTMPSKFLAETKHIFGSVVNFASPNRMWNCHNTCTAQTLETAITAFSTRIIEINSEIDGMDDSASLQTLRQELADIQVLLQSSLKTLFYIYRTYNQNPNVGEETEEIPVGNEEEVIRPQYQALLSLINRDLSSLLQQIDVKLNPHQPLAEVAMDNGEKEVEILIPWKDGAEEDPQVEQEAYAAALEVMADKTLVFKSQMAASKWFCRKLTSCRGSNGDDAHADLIRGARIAKTVPKPFILFAKTLDAVFNEKMARYDFLSKVYERFNQILMNSGTENEAKKPNNFKMLLSELCEKNAPRHVYQALFKALMNEEGTAPYGLKYEPAVLNAIMNNPDYFPIFDPDHEMVT
ncbi:MAG: hypothetical protein JSS60_03900 [Verrucomicrobia bacterium]|nr:hypothetical protein [Verrucomicrobiota bacterium]